MDVLVDAVKQALNLLLTGDAYLWGIIARSLQVSGMAVLLGLLIGIPLGTWLGLARFPGRGVAVALVNTGLALPPVVVGLFVYIMLSRQGPFGELQWLYTPSAMITAQFVLAAPYVAAITLAAVQSVPSELRLQARALGASRWAAASSSAIAASRSTGSAFSSMTNSKRVFNSNFRNKGVLGIRL